MPIGFFEDLGESIRLAFYHGKNDGKDGIMTFNHLHPYYEIYFCPFKIKQKLVINGNTYIYETPCVIITDPFTLHSMSRFEDRIYDRICIYFGKKTISGFSRRFLPDGFLQSKGGSIIELTEEQSLLLFELIRNYADHPENYTQEEKELVAILFLNRVFQIADKEKIVSIGNPDFYIPDVMHYIAENYHDNLNSNLIAKHFAISRSKLDRDFRTGTGYTVHDFIDNCRLNEARSMLRQKKGPSVKEIAAHCGFRNETYFYHFFKRHIGMSPLEFRKKIYTHYEFI